MVEDEQEHSEYATPGFALSIVIPVYNGAGSIPELIGALEELPIGGGHEIILVNDASPDNSLEVCKALIDKARVPITLINLARNYGEHNAVMTGLRHARGAHIITMDDDLQNPPEEVQRLLAFAQETGKEIIYTYYDDKQHSFGRNRRSDGGCRGAVFRNPARLGFAVRGGAGAVGRAADDPRHHRRIPGPAVSDSQWKAAIGSKRGASQPSPVSCRGASAGLVTR